MFFNDFNNYLIIKNMNCEKHKSECTECIKNQIKELEDKLAELKKKLPPCPVMQTVYYLYKPLIDKTVW